MIYLDIAQNNYKNKIMPDNIRKATKYNMANMARTIDVVVPNRIKNASSETKAAVIDQGSAEISPGVDVWGIEATTILSDTILVQFDHRPQEQIERIENVVSSYFTTLKTLEQCITSDDTVDAAMLAEMLQVAPFRALGETISTYPRYVVVYTVTKPFYVAQSIAQSNMHLGKGGAIQYRSQISRDEIISHLELLKIIPTVNRETKNLVIQKMDAVNAAISVVARVFQKLFGKIVKDLSINSPLLVHTILQGNEDRRFCIKENTIED